MASDLPDDSMLNCLCCKRVMCLPVLHSCGKCHTCAYCAEEYVEHQCGKEKGERCSRTHMCWKGTGPACGCWSVSRRMYSCIVEKGKSVICPYCSTLVHPSETYRHVVEDCEMVLVRSNGFFYSQPVYVHPNFIYSTLRRRNRRR